MADSQRCPNCGREMPAHAPQGLCPACLLGGVLVSQDETQSVQAEPESTAGAPGEPGATVYGESTEIDGITFSVVSGQAGPSADPALTANFAPGDGLAGDEGSVEPGTRIRYFGDYEIRGKLGSGAMGVVYKARQISLNRTVALKMIRAGELADEEELRRFQNEAEAVARLDHPGIVPIFEVGQFEEQHYFSMKLVAGESLDKHLKEHAADPRRAARLVSVAAGAIHHAHQRGILHRDLKPANVLVDAQEQPHITDFGLAKRVEGDSELTQSGAILGTPAYMAPEQASGKRGAVTTSTDVYGLGAILFALLAGRAPFCGTTVLDTLEQVRERPPDSLRKLNPRVPRDLEVICLKCLAKDPRRRYASADALAEDLTHWLAGEPIAARPVGSAARLWMWCRRNPVVAAAAGLMAASLVVVAVLSLFYAGQQARLAQAKTLYAEEQQLRATEQIAAMARITLLAQQLQQESQALRSSLAESNRRLAMLNFERGQTAFEQGEIGRGLLWMVETLRNATEAGDPAWKHAALANLSAWRPLYPKLKEVHADAGFESTVAYQRFLGRRFGVDIIFLTSTSSSVRLPDMSFRDLMDQSWNLANAASVLSISPDGKIILTGAGQPVTRLRDATTSTPIGQPMEHQGKVCAGRFSPDGKTVLTVSSDNTVRLWDADSGRLIGEPMKHAFDVVNSPGPTIQTVVISPNGKTILTVNGPFNEVLLWDMATTRLIGSGGRLPGLDSRVACVAFSPEGKTVLTGSHLGDAQLWDAATGHPIGQPVRHQAAITAVAFSPNGRIILTRTKDTIRLWDATTWSTGQIDDQERYVVVAPSDAKVRTGLDERGRGSSRRWTAAFGQPIGQPLRHNAPVLAVAFSADGKTALTGSRDGTARLWDADTGRPIGKPLEHRAPVWALASSPDGKAILTGGGTKGVRRWSAATGSPIGKALVHEGYVTAMVFDPDGDVALAVGADGVARLADIDKGWAIGRPLEHQGSVLAVAFSRDGKTILTAGADGAVRLWDALSGQAIGQPFQQRVVVLGATFSPDGRTILTGADDGTARLWDISTGQSVGQPLKHRGPIVAVAFSPDGKTILTGSYDKTARLWDTATGRPIGRPLEHQAAILAVAFSPDGKTVLTGSQDKTAQLWNVPAELDDDLPRLAAWVGTLTGLEFDGQHPVAVLDDTSWWQGRERLMKHGGPPSAGSQWLIDPIHYESDPLAHARSCVERQQWDAAEAEFEAVVRAWPDITKFRLARGRFYLARSLPAKAASDFSEAVLLEPDELDIRRSQILTLLAAGDREGVRRAAFDLLDRFGRTTNPWQANNIAWFCTLAPGAVADPAIPVRMAEFALQVEPIQKYVVLHTLGATLYRAGRFEDAIRRLNEGIRLRGGTEEPFDWPFLAMAHHRLGHHDEALRWLDRFRHQQPSTLRDQFWDDFEIRVLRSEAEALVLYDPVFPADPFAR